MIFGCSHADDAFHDKAITVVLGLNYEASSLAMRLGKKVLTLCLRSERLVPQ